MVIVTSAVEAVHGELAIVQRTTTGPLPLVCVKVAFAVVAFGLKVPAPPLTTDQLPVPVVGVLPPRPVVVPKAQIVCAPPTVAVVGGCVMVMVTLAVEAVHGELAIVQRTTTGPLPLVWVKVAFAVLASGLKVPAPPLTTD